MKLLKLKIIKAETCGGLLDGLVVPFRANKADTSLFSPLCLIGPNGTGKSQVLQLIAEIFQAVFHKYLGEEEQGKPNDKIEFEIEYLINLENNTTEYVRISRRKEGRKKANIVLERYIEDNWAIVDDLELIPQLLPTKVIGYTSGDNETLSIPFFVSRAGYARQVRENARDDDKRSLPIQDTRMLLIDYSTNLEVLVANLLLNSTDIRKALLEASNLKELRSFRCIIQLKYGTGSSKIVELTDELRTYIDDLQRSSTCFQFDSKNQKYTFDFFISDATHKAFHKYWQSALKLYSCFHKLAMLNDLVIPSTARKSFIKGIESRHFSTRLPEPLEEHKVFRFERVEFISQKSDKPVDYVSLSDGEHQFAQLLGTMCMASFPNVLFLLDEPESHFNPKWRVEFISKILEFPTCGGEREKLSDVAQQDCLITTHSPFVPSDMKSENVLIFSKNKEIDMIEVRHPQIQTFGSKFDAILAECFNISPPISALSRDRVSQLLENGSKEQIVQAMTELGESTAKMRLAAKLSLLQGES